MAVKEGREMMDEAEIKRLDTFRWLKVYTPVGARRRDHAGWRLTKYKPNHQNAHNLGIGLRQLKIKAVGLAKAINLFEPKWNRPSGGFRLDRVGEAADWVREVNKSLDGVIAEFKDILSWLDRCYEVEEDIPLYENRQVRARVATQVAEEHKQLQKFYSAVQRIHKATPDRAKRNGHAKRI